MVERDGHLQAGAKTCDVSAALIDDIIKRTRTLHMIFSKKLIALLALLPALAFANEAGYPLDKAPERDSLTSLQNGAKLFVNYCLNCHQASAMRYNRLRDLGLTEDQIK